MGFVLSTILALAALAGHGSPVVVAVHGRMHLSTAGQQDHYGRISLKPFHRSEGRSTSVTLREDPDYGLRLHSAIDIIGPDWLMFDIEEYRDGIVVSTYDTGTGLGESLWYPTFDDLRDAEGKQAILIQSTIDRAHIVFLDFDHP